MSIICIGGLVRWFCFFCTSRFFRGMWPYCVLFLAKQLGTTYHAVFGPVKLQSASLDTQT